jgi:subtilase family serine protease
LFQSVDASLDAQQSAAWCCPHHRALRPRTATQPKSGYTINANLQALVPGDLETIYNMNPLYEHGVSGQGQTIDHPVYR